MAGIPRRAPRGCTRLAGSGARRCALCGNLTQPPAPPAAAPPRPLGRGRAPAGGRQARGEARPPRSWARSWRRRRRRRRKRAAASPSGRCRSARRHPCRRSYARRGRKWNARRWDRRRARARPACVARRRQRRRRAARPTRSPRRSPSGVFRQMCRCSGQ